MCLCVKHNTVRLIRTLGRNSAKIQKSEFSLKIVLCMYSNNYRAYHPAKEIKATENRSPTNYLQKQIRKKAKYVHYLLILFLFHELKNKFAIS